MFGVIGRIGNAKPTTNDGDITDESDEASKPVLDAPINAVILSVFLGAIFILFGNFRDLLTVTGLGEYSFFFLACLGAVILRYREPDLHRPYKPLVIIPMIFVLVSGFVVIRGAVFAPQLAAVIIGVWIVGLVYYWIKKRWFTRSLEAHHS